MFCKRYFVLKCRWLHIEARDLIKKVTSLINVYSGSSSHGVSGGVSPLHSGQSWLGSSSCQSWALPRFVQHGPFCWAKHLLISFNLARSSPLEWCVSAHANSATASSHIWLYESCSQDSQEDLHCVVRGELLPGDQAKYVPWAPCN